MCKNRGNGHKQSSHTTTRLTYGGNMATRTRGGHTHVGDVRNGDFKAQEGAFPLLGSIWMHLDHYNEVSTLISGRDMFKPLRLFNLGWKGNRIIHNSLTTLNADNLKHCLHVWSYEYYE